MKPALTELGVSSLSVAVQVTVVEPEAGLAANWGQGTLLIHHSRRLVGHNDPVGTGSGGRDVGWHIAEREIRVVDRHGEALADRNYGYSHKR